VFIWNLSLETLYLYSSLVHSRKFCNMSQNNHICFLSSINCHSYVRPESVVAITEITDFCWDVSPCWRFSESRHLSWSTRIGPDAAGSRILLNVRTLQPVFTASHPRKPESSITFLLVNTYCLLRCPLTDGWSSNIGFSAAKKKTKSVQ
jgi:hypothetical protein